jgi:hypothetical protein
MRGSPTHVLARARWPVLKRSLMVGFEVITEASLEKHRR